MSLVQRLDEIFEAAKAKAYEFETPIADSLKAIAAHVESIAPGAGDVAGKVEQLVASKIGDAQKALEENLTKALGNAATALEARVQAAVEQFNAGIDQRVTDLFGQLLAKATADEQAKQPATAAAPQPPDPNAAAQAAPQA